MTCDCHVLEMDGWENTIADGMVKRCSDAAVVVGSAAHLRQRSFYLLLDE